MTVHDYLFNTPKPESVILTNLHNLDKFEKQLLSVLGFLLLDYQRADPVELE